VSLVGLSFGVQFPSGFLCEIRESTVRPRPTTDDWKIKVGQGTQKTLYEPSRCGGSNNCQEQVLNTLDASGTRQLSSANIKLI